MREKGTPVHIIYHCYGGAHSSVVGAAIHLGFLPQEEPASAEQLWSIRYYDKQDQGDHGRIRFMGRDRDGHQVYILGCRNHFHILEKSIGEIGRVMGVSLDDVRFVDTLPCVNWSMRIGGFLSRFMGLRAIGRPLVIRGTRKAYQCLADLARETRAAVR